MGRTSGKKEKSPPPGVGRLQTGWFPKKKKRGKGAFQFKRASPSTKEVPEVTQSQTFPVEGHKGRGIKKKCKLSPAYFRKRLERGLLKAREKGLKGVSIKWWNSRDQRENGRVVRSVVKDNLIMRRRCQGPTGGDGRGKSERGVSGGGKDSLFIHGGGRRKPRLRIQGRKTIKKWLRIEGKGL